MGSNVQACTIRCWQSLQVAVWCVQQFRHLAGKAASRLRSPGRERRSLAQFGDQICWIPTDLMLVDGADRFHAYAYAARLHVYHGGLSQLRQ